MSFGDDPKYSVGYRKPPVATRFKPGTSDNPKGRPKDKPSLKSTALKVYTDMVTVHEGVKTLRIPRLIFLMRRQVDMGIKGNVRAAQVAIKTATELGAFQESEPNPGFDYSVLTDDELQTLIPIVKKLEGRR